MLNNSNGYTTGGRDSSHLVSPPAPPPGILKANEASQRTGSRFHEHWDSSRHGSSDMHDLGSSFGSQRHGYANNANSTAMPLSLPQSSVEGYDELPMDSGRVGGRERGKDRDSVITTISLPERRNTLKKKASLGRSSSLGSSSSRRSIRAGSVRSLALHSTSDSKEMNSVFYCPVPTSGNPTDGLANRFQAWRKILKDLIAYFRELSVYDEQRAKSLNKLASVASAMAPPIGFLGSGRLEAAIGVLRHYNKTILADICRAREIEAEVILSLSRLRSDLQLKIKEIKNLSGDFKNTVEKEMEATRRAVKVLQEGLGQSDLDSALTVGKQDPYLLRLAIDRQVCRQLEEENYLHQAYINLESCGRELESIVIGEIQKAYSAYRQILKTEADGAYLAIEALRVGPIMMPKDQEWSSFVERDDRFVGPNIPMRSIQHVHYPDQNHPSCQEVRAGLLERKSKYLKSYTAGWYVLSLTHIHEFKSADKGQAPIMSLYLPEQKLGPHSAKGSLSNKFVLKGRQTGAMHRGHTWVFRAESYDTMLAWYGHIKVLTERSPEDRSALLRGHSRSVSRSSQFSASSDGVVDEDDEEPFAANAVLDVKVSNQQQPQPPEDPARRMPPPGERFPSEIQLDTQRHFEAHRSPSIISSGGKELSPGLGSLQSGLTEAQPEPTIRDVDRSSGMLSRLPAEGMAGADATRFQQGSMEATPSLAALETQHAALTANTRTSSFARTIEESIHDPVAPTDEPCGYANTANLSSLHVPGEYPRTLPSL